MRFSKILKSAIIQAAVLVLIALAAAFAYNSISESGIDPLSGRAGGAGSERRTRVENYGVAIIDIDQTVKMLENGAVLLDARTRSAYEKGHIPGAILFDFYMFQKYVDLVLPQLDPTRYTIIYCESPECGVAELLARELYSLGYENLHVFRGGFSRWEEMGRPVEGGGLDD